MKRTTIIDSLRVHKVIRSEFRSSKKTNYVGLAEEEFASLLGVKYAIGFVNGTATLHTALESLGIGAGDEVIVPPLTMSATCFSVLQANATPVFADVDPETWQISAQSVRTKITSRTKAIVTVALYGGVPDYKSLQAVAPDIPLIEDNAQALGSLYFGEHIGRFGRFSSYSFQSSKHISSGEGGMLLTNSDLLADTARRIQSLGYIAVGAKSGKISKEKIQSPDYERHEILGWNYRMPELIGAAILGQVTRARKLWERRIEVANHIIEIAHKSNLLKAQGIHPGVDHSYWACPFLLDTSKVDWNTFRNTFRDFGGKGIYSAWKVNYLEPVFRSRSFLGRENMISEANSLSYQEGECPISEEIQPKVLAFRTNEWTKQALKSQTDALEKTLRFFD